MQFYKEGFRGGNPDVKPAAPDRRARGPFESLPDQVDVLIAGCGPPGLCLAAQLAQFSDIETMIVEGDLSDLAMRWRSDQSVVLVDAVHSERPPGTVVTIDGLADTPMVHGRPISSHGVGVPEAIELARLLNRLPGSLVIYGVEAGSFDHFAPLSEPVAAALPGLAQRILEELGAG